MDFARKQLEKYGWTDGKGLGKNENGISEALKPKLKRSVTGIGHDPAADFTEHWWSALYDKAAKNVEVEEKDGKTKKIKTKDDQFKITSSTYQLNKKPGATDKEEYSEFFIRKAVLTGESQEKVGESESEEENEKRDVFKLTDEELFAACEGRTAHKGARHGLKATGKLARIAQQEQMLLNQPQYEGYSHAKKLKKDKNTLQHDNVVEDANLNNEEYCIQNKKKKKKKRKRCLSNENVDNVAESTEPLPVEKDTEMAGDNISINKKCKKSKRKQKYDQDEECSTNSKKNKKQQINAMEVDPSHTQIEESEPKVKKCKKKKKKDSDM
ncbi:G patch domain-containing protein 4 [Pectinophora gossypiella]|uniref:G patch domain-containing protein 4 n=1 Tax=Pectinophora gossypiella TaxID=13191 RepID=UPI00214F202E|nr:G patch domain-containing protein 4 [Pectinophora gossypiella]